MIAGSGNRDSIHMWRGASGLYGEVFEGLAGPEPFRGMVGDLLGDLAVAESSRIGVN